MVQSYFLSYIVIFSYKNKRLLSCRLLLPNEIDKVDIVELIGTILKTGDGEDVIAFQRIEFRFVFYPFIVPYWFICFSEITII